MLRLLRARPTVLALLAVAVVATPLATGPPAVAGSPTPYQRPVPGPVVAPFDPPAAPWGPGNRGVDLATTPGEPVRAAGDGVVRFAGPVAGTLHVTVAHPDGLRTSYSFVAEVRVVVGQRVQAGDVVATAGALLHWGVRDPTGTYLDPQALLAAPRRAVLVPGGDDGAPRPAPGGELAALAAVAWEAAVRLGPTLAPPATGPAGAALAHQLGRLHSWGRTADLLVPLLERFVVDRPCTPADVAPPRPGARVRRIAVLVGGVGSTSGSAAIDDLDVGALGYARHDVLRFSYRGGRTPPPGTGSAGPLGGLRSATYDADDSQGDLWAAGRALGELLSAVAEAEPGVPIDVLAHSQGGVVTRLALTAPDVPEEVDAVVTLATPHGGADLATAAVALGGSPSGRGLLAALRAAGLPADPGRPALAQLSEGSPVVAALAASPPPPGVRLTSIGARGDLTVPAPRTQEGGASGPVVPLDGPTAHGRLPGHPLATREVALAVAGLPPTCETTADAVSDLVVGSAVSWAEDTLGVAAVAADQALGPP